MVVVHLPMQDDKRCRFNPRVKIQGVVNGNILQYSYLEVHEQRKLMGSSPWSCLLTESEPTEVTDTHSGMVFVTY